MPVHPPHPPDRSRIPSEKTKWGSNVQRMWIDRIKWMSAKVVHHAVKHTGVGFVCAVAYFDPGNWGVDLQAGSEYGYRLLFIVLLSGIFAVFLQILACRLGCVTGLDLASNCRLLLYNRPKHKLLYRWLLHYPLYLLSEVAIIATDLAELLGSAIALCMLFPKLQLWHGVLITAADVFILLAFGDPLRGRPARVFEVVIAVLVMIVLICMAIIIPKAGVHWGIAFQGYLPSKYIFTSGALYTSVGIIGATVMPHGLFLGSALATQDRISPPPPKIKEKEEEGSNGLGLAIDSKFRYRRAVRTVKENIVAPFRIPPQNSTAERHSDHENKPYAFVMAHLYHGAADIVISLLCIAVVVNSLILILASAVFFYGTKANTLDSPANLFDAYNVIRDTIGQWAGTLFAISLLAAGESSSIIATVAGQAVSEGFLRWRLSPIMRRTLTRLIAIIPSMIVAVVGGKRGVDVLLVTSQVVLSIVLPFVVVPLVYLTSSKSIMTVRKPRDLSSPIGSETGATPQEQESAEGDEMVDFSNGRITTAVGVLLCLLITAADVYVLATL